MRKKYTKYVVVSKNSITFAADLHKDTKRRLIKLKNILS